MKELLLFFTIYIAGASGGHVATKLVERCLRNCKVCDDNCCSSQKDKCSCLHTGACSCVDPTAR